MPSGGSLVRFLYSWKRRLDATVDAIVSPDSLVGLDEAMMWNLGSRQRAIDNVNISTP